MKLKPHRQRNVLAVVAQESREVELNLQVLVVADLYPILELFPPRFFDTQNGISLLVLVPESALNLINPAASCRHAWKCVAQWCNEPSGL